MKRIPITSIRTKEKARAIAQQWQNWASQKALSYYDMIMWGYYFDALGQKFNLTKEFQENGII